MQRQDFLNAFRSDDAKQETRTDFAIAQRAGITGFPTLLAGVGHRAEYVVVTQGYQPPERMISTLERWMQED